MCPLFMSVAILVVLKTPFNFASIISRDEHFQTETTSSAVLHTNVYPCEPCICERGFNTITAICSNRRLTSVPNISNAANITALLMDTNQLSTLEKGCLSRFTNLNELNLASNRLTKIDEGAFQMLHKLQILNLENNKLSYVESVFNENLFQQLQNLKMLILRNNNLQDDKNAKYPDKALSVLRSLQELYLDGLTNQSFGKGFSNLTNLTHLSLAGQNSHCSVIGLFNTTFTHVCYVKVLNLSSCDVQYIEPGTFVPLKSSLDVLDISHNSKLKFNGLFNGSFGWQHSNLRVLNFSYIVGKYEQCVVFTKSNLQYMRNTKIQEIYADGNRIQIFETGAIALLPPTLRKMTMKSSWFSPGKYLLESVSLRQLVELDLSGLAGARNLPLSGLDYIAKCSENGCFENEDDSSCSVLAATDGEDGIINMADNGTENVPLFSIPPKLQILKNTFQQLTFRITTVTIRNNSLKVINASFNVLSIWEGPILGLNNLTHLDLSNNVAIHVNSSFFDNFTSLIMLNISNNLLGNPIAQDRNGDIFKNLKSVEILDLSTNNLQMIPEHLFKGMPSLKVLKLSDNNLVYIPIHVKHMSNLQKIDLAGNEIEWLPYMLMTELDSLVETNNHSITIDLSNNPISCECQNLNFLKWMLHTKVKQADMTKYYCIDYDGHFVNLTNFPAVLDSLTASCASYKYITLASFIMFFSFWLIFFACLMYKYRWQLRYWYYGIRYRFKYSQANSDDTFSHDAFISYAEEDETFIERMEEKMKEEGKKLVRGKDFIGGRPIAVNIFRCIRESRKTVLVLSQHFLKSMWCKYEMEMAYQECAHTDRDVLLLLLLEDINCTKLPRIALQLLQSDRYLEYKDDENNDLFWRRFVDKIS